MILSENQVRNVYYVSGVVDATPSVKGNINFVKTISNKIYGEYMGPQRFGKNDGLVITDDFKKDNIESIVISCPKGIALKEWTITMPTSPVSGANYRIHFDFEDWFGVGPDHFYHKFAIVHAVQGETQSTLAAKMKAQIEKQFMREAVQPFTVTTGSGTVIIKENAQSYDMLRRVDPNGIKCTISIVENDEDSSWNSSLIAMTETAQKNGKIMEALEYAALGARADMYGYKGFPAINPSDIVGVYSDTTDYVSVDIRYYKNEGTAPDVKQRKEMTFICADFATAKNIVENAVFGYAVKASSMSAGDSEIVDLNSKKAQQSQS